MAETVYFTKTITPERVLGLYGLLDAKLTGRVAAKVHSGEEGNQNFLRPSFWKPVIDAVHGTVVETNTAYGGARSTTERHRKLLQDHGWTGSFDVDLLDAEGPDLRLPIPDGLALKENLVGKDLQKYDSMLVLAHFKGHPMGGFGGALKQLSIGCASAAGKANIHSAGATDNPDRCWGIHAPKPRFCEAMADAAGSVIRFFEGRIAYINVMANLSVDCDCCSDAEDPCMADIGVLASLDPVALDQACLDLVYGSKDPGRKQLIERIESRGGLHTVEAAAQIGYGSREYKLVDVDA